jgi:peptide/nickel transport system substrate-binding protein
MRWHRAIRLAIAAFTVGLLLNSATSNASARELIFGTGVPITSFDPHFYNATGNNSATQHVFEPLVSLDASLKLVPALAVSWQAIADDLWEFKLRANVKWHDGKPFTADDVAFTLSRVGNVPNSPGGFGGYIRGITKVEVVDDLTVRIHADRKLPMLPTDLASVSIVSRHGGSAATTDDYNNGSAAIGTGPYKLKKFQFGEGLVLVRNASWWGPKQPWDEIVYRFIPNPAARTAAILSGDVDIIDQVPAPDLARLRANPQLSIAEASGTQMIHLTMNMSITSSLVNATGPDGSPLKSNPFLDRRLRQALSFAIDRSALVKNVMDGTAVATGQWVPAGLMGYASDIPVPKFDRREARRLLTEAGFPNGFRLTLSTPNDRYPNDSRVSQAVAQMWTRVGVQTEVDAIPFAVLSGKAVRQELAVWLLGWGNGNPSSPMVNLFSTADKGKGLGGYNNGRYSSPDFDALVSKTLSTMDAADRERLFVASSKFASEDVAFIPLFFINNYWATKRSIVLEARPDTYTMLTGARPAP